MGITEKIAHAKKTKWVTEGLSDYEIKIIVESAKNLLRIQNPNLASKNVI